MIRLGLFEPEIPENTGTLLRMGACLNVGLDIIHPCGFIFSHRRLRRAGMDYITHSHYQEHDTWDTFYNHARHTHRRLVLVDADPTGIPYTQFTFTSEDVLIMGKESSGVPPDVAKTCDAIIRIPMAHGMRSLNVAIAAAIVVGEALRQLQP